jgi:hypothetical protein
MTLPEILSELIARGVRPDVVVEISALFSDRAAADKIRGQTRERVRRHRNLKERVTLRNDSVTLHPPGYTSSLLTESPINKKEVSKSMHKRRLPENFALTDADRNFACERGWDGNRIKTEFERFCDHATAGGRKLVDWHAGWRTWVSSPYNGAKVNGYAKPQRETLAEQCDRLAADLRAKMVRQDDTGRGNDGPQTNVVSLSRDQYGLFK